MAMKTYASESMAYLLSSNMDRGSTDYQIEAAITKVFASEVSFFNLHFQFFSFLFHFHCFINPIAIH